MPLSMMKDAESRDRESENPTSANWKPGKAPPDRPLLITEIYEPQIGKAPVPVAGYVLKHDADALRLPRGKRGQAEVDNVHVSTQFVGVQHAHGDNFLLHNFVEPVAEGQLGPRPSDGPLARVCHAAIQV